MSDDELERLMRRRMAEMQRNISGKKPAPKRTPRDILAASLGYRGLEVLENAERQYPAQTAPIVRRIAELITRGEIRQAISGGELLELYRVIGLPIRMKTRISVEQDGKLVSLSDKLKTGRE